jgi:hypothetical protein
MGCTSSPEGSIYGQLLLLVVFVAAVFGMKEKEESEHGEVTGVSPVGKIRVRGDDLEDLRRGAFTWIP